MNDGKRCDSCGTNFLKKTTYKIWKHAREIDEVEDRKNSCCELQEVCCECYSKYFVRRQLDKKTSDHARFDAFSL